MPELLVKEESKEQIVTMAEDSVTIGRAGENNVVLADVAASGRHCMIQTEEGGYRVIDLNSRNGTIVNGKAIDSSSSLKDGDAIGIGKAVIVFYTETIPGKARLLVVDGDGKKSVCGLSDQTAGIGRLSGNEICFAHPGVSNFHAQISFENGTYRIQDLGSTNGTKVNGTFITSAELKDNDRIEVGPYTATYRSASDVGTVRPEGEDRDNNAAAAEVVVPQQPRVRPVMTPAVRPGGDKLIVAAALLVGLGVLWVMIEAVVLRSGESSGPPPDSKLNLIIGNVSFEDAMQDDGSLPYWHVRTDTHSVVKLTREMGHWGPSSLDVQSMSGAPANSWALCVHSEDVPVDRGRAYRGSFWVKTRDRKGLSAVGLEWVNKANRQILGEDVGHVLTDATEWTKISVSGIPPEGANRVRMFFSTYGGEKGSLWLDDATLHEMPTEKVGTVRFEAALGESRLMMDRKGVVSLAAGGAILLRRVECSAGAGAGECRQSLGVVSRGYPSVGEDGLTVRGKLYDFSSGTWMKYEQRVVAQGGSARIDYSIWPEEDTVLTALDLFVFLPPDVLEEGRLKAVAGGKPWVVESLFVKGGVESISWSLGRDGVTLDTSSFGKVTLKDGGRRGLFLVLNKRVGKVLPGMSVDGSLVITPLRIDVP